MKVLNFPGAAVLNQDFKIEKTSTIDSNGQLCVGGFNFTCTNCSNITTFKFEKAIFKKVELYCGCCGSFYKIVNPAFGSSKVK